MVIGQFRSEIRINKYFKKKAFTYAEYAREKCFIHVFILKLKLLRLISEMYHLCVYNIIFNGYFFTMK